MAVVQYVHFKGRVHFIVILAVCPYDFFGIVAFEDENMCVESAKDELVGVGEDRHQGMCKRQRKATNMHMYMMDSVYCNDW